MFTFRKWADIKDRFYRIESSLQDMSTRLSFYSQHKDSITTCDDCGCLLFKEKRFKLPSTVKVIEELQGWIGYSGNPPPPVKISREVIVEHYKCLSCNPQAE